MLSWLVGSATCLRSLELHLENLPANTLELLEGFLASTYNQVRENVVFKDAYRSDIFVLRKPKDSGQTQLPSPRSQRLQ